MKAEFQANQEIKINIESNQGKQLNGITVPRAHSRKSQHNRCDGTQPVMLGVKFMSSASTQNCRMTPTISNKKFNFDKINQFQNQIFNQAKVCMQSANRAQST